MYDGFLVDGAIATLITPKVHSSQAHQRCPAKEQEHFGGVGEVQVAAVA